MAKTNGEFSAIVHTVLEKTPVRELLGSGDAVVLERIARGGGATAWYYCRTGRELDAIEGRLSPGSVTSFYFDARIRRARYSPQFVTDVESIIVKAGDAFVGALGEDGIEINAEIVVSRDDLMETMSTIPRSSELFYGAFPARDNDGAAAVTVTLPDRDGVVRAHPH